MARATLYNMIYKIEEIRFECFEGNTEQASKLLSMFLARKNIRYINYYTTPYNSKLIVIQLSNPADKEKVLEIENFEQDLRTIKCKIYKSTNNNNSEKSHRTIFLFNLRSDLFLLFYHSRRP